jgi:hypothetical protein
VSKAVDDSGDRFERVGARSGLEDWRRWPGLETYAGTVRYRGSFQWQGGSGAVGLDAGRVEEAAELVVNGKRAGVRLAPPYVWDISGVVRTGPNEFHLDVTNTAATRWKDGFSHGDAASGLFGPVMLLLERK